MNIDPSSTAIVCVECQEGVLGASSALPALRDSAAPMVPVLARLLRSARAAGVAVIHATYEGPLGGTQGRTARLWATLGSRTDDWTPGSPPTRVLPELLEPADIVLPRHHGLNPAAGTELIPLLTARGVQTVVLTGVSLNVALLLTAGDVCEAGLSVVVPRDAVTATPASYADDVLSYSMGMLATLTTVDELAASWEAGIS